MRFLMCVAIVLLCGCGRNVQPPVTVNNVPPVLETDNNDEFIARCQNEFGQAYSQTWLVQSWVNGQGYVDLLQTNDQFIRVPGTCTFQSLN